MMLTKQRNKIKITCKTCNYDAFFKRRQQKMIIYKTIIQTHQTEKCRPQLQNCRIYYPHNRYFLSSSDFCL